MDTTEIAASPAPSPKKGKGKSNAEAFRAAIAQVPAPAQARNPEVSLQGEDPGPIMLKSTPLPAMTSVEGTPAPAATPPVQSSPVVSIPPDDLARARLALIRSGMLPSEVDALDSAKILERGQKRQKALEADDEAHRLANEWRTKLGQEPKGGKEPAQPLSTERAVPAPDLKATLEPLAKALLLDDEGLALLEKSFSTFAQQAIAPIQSELASLKQSSGEGAKQAERVTIESSRAKLVDRFPELADPTRFQEVYAEMEALASRPRYQSAGTATELVDRLMLDASRAIGLQEQGGPNTSEEEARKRQRAESRSTVPPAANQAAPQDLQDRQWAYFKHIREHPGDIVGAKKAGGYL